MLNFSLVYVNISFFTSILSILLFFLIWRKRHVSGSRSLLIVVIAVTIYNLAYALDYSASTQDMKIFWSKWEYVALFTLLPSLFLFVLEYFGITTKMRPRNLFFLWIVPVVIVGLVWTNEQHGLIWSVSVRLIRLPI